MNNKGIGAVFCLISAVLASTRYLAATIYMSNVTSWSNKMFQDGLDYVGSPLNTAACITLVAGICFLGYGIFQDFKKKDK